MVVLYNLDLHTPPCIHSITEIDIYSILERYKIIAEFFFLKNIFYDLFFQNYKPCINFTKTYLKHRLSHLLRILGDWYVCRFDNIGRIMYTSEWQLKVNCRKNLGWSANCWLSQPKFHSTVYFQL